MVEEDAEVLERYSRADEARIKELTLRMEKLAGEATKAQRDLESEVLQTQTHRIGLDKAGTEFRRIHAEQQQLTQLWQETIGAMEQRDQEIDAQAERFQDLRRRAAERQAVVREKDEFYAEMQRANADTRREVDLVERQMLRAREELLSAEQQLQRFQDEVRGRGREGERGGN